MTRLVQLILTRRTTCNWPPEFLERLGALAARGRR